MDALGDLDRVVESGQVVLADPAGLMGERLRRVQGAVLGVRSARSGNLGADHRGVPDVRVVLPEVQRGVLATLGCARPCELRQRCRSDERQRAGEHLLTREMFSHVELLS